MSGRNWTDAVLRAYGRIETVLERVAGSASVDIEPQTLVWLLGRDEAAYRQVISAYERGTMALVVTPPFHPILPHHHRLEREALFELMIDFYAPLLRRAQPRTIGLWLPEAAYSADTVTNFLDSARRATIHYEGLPDLVHRIHLILDARQLGAAEEATTAWGKTGLDGGVPFAARDPVLSGDFAFGASTAEKFASKADARGASSLLVASDLESLLANSRQADRFVGIVEALRAHDIKVTFPIPPERPMTADVLDLSSWSDYDEHLMHGRTSDTRWAGIRRSDGLVLSRVHRGEALSQLWKHAFTLGTERIETAIRRSAMLVLKGLGVDRRHDAIRRLAVAYGRHVFHPHYCAFGLAREEIDFAGAAEAILRGKVDVETAGYLARGYLMLLMGLRSDARFWDNPDTRVTFQNVALLSQAVVDMSEACARAGERERGTRLMRILRAAFLEFADAYGHGSFGDLHGVEGWETSEAAWLRSLQSEVPARSGYDVFRRAALYSVGDAFRKMPSADVQARAEEIVADTGHIVGEAHGGWENPTWCEHRP